MTEAKSKRKEIQGILFTFLVILTLISLLSYNQLDPSLNHATSVKKIHNLFGLVGAHLAGLLIGLFGMGAFWVPVLLFLATVHSFGLYTPKTRFSIFIGGILLIISTGSLFSIRSDQLMILGTTFSAGGGVGCVVRDFLGAYTGKIGSTLILLVVLLVGLVLSISFSPTKFAIRVWTLAGKLIGKVHGLFVIWKARREKKKLHPPPQQKKIKEKTLEIKIKAPAPVPITPPPAPKQEEFDFMRSKNDFRLPSPKFLNEPESRTGSVDDENLRMQSLMLEKKLNDFGVSGKVSEVSPGPVITTFEYQPAPGVKINKIVNLADDLALALRAMSIRIVAPIPGKAAIGIEIPNSARETVYFKEIVMSSQFGKSKSKMTICLGKDIVGHPVVAELDRMPHLLIAGATGAGKSVGLNVMITSLLYKATPEDVKLIMIDPKRIELSVYDGIPHLITPVVTDMKKATNALFWAVKEMERRYELLSTFQVRNINQYNQKIAKEKKPASEDTPPPERLPYIIIIIDELADLMMVSSRDVEVGLTRLAQMARAAGIHLVLATQRPSVDVLTGIIKANFPTRISFQVSSKTDSRTILDTNGAENLLGNGDMLYLPPGTAKLQRIHGAYISEEELQRIIEFLKEQKPPEYDESVIQPQAQDTSEETPEDVDDKYDEAVALVTKAGQASISMIQRHLRIGYNRAARIIEMMESEGVIGPADGAKPREVLVRGYHDI